MLMLEGIPAGWQPLQLTGLTSIFGGVKAYCNYAQLSGLSKNMNTALVNLRLSLKAALENVVSAVKQPEIYEAYGITDDSQLDPLFGAIALLSSAGKTSQICSSITPEKLGPQLGKIVAVTMQKKDQEMVTAKVQAVISQYAFDAAGGSGGGTSSGSGSSGGSGGGSKPPAYTPPMTSGFTASSLLTKRNMGIALLLAAAGGAAYSVYTKKKRMEA